MVITVGPERRALWLRYLEHLAGHLGLCDWRTYLDEKLPEKPPHIDGELGATFEATWGKKVGHIRLCDDWEDLEPDEQRDMAVHELVHPHFWQADLYVNQVLFEHLNSREASWHDRQYNYLHEFGIDAVAKLLAPSLPLPADVVPQLGKVVEPATKKGAKS